jgi:hypothetical protein
MTSRKNIEILSAGCPACDEAIARVRQLAGSAHDITILDMREPHVAARAKRLGVGSVPAVIIDGQLAGCCAGRGPDEAVLRAALV